MAVAAPAKDSARGTCRSRPSSAVAICGLAATEWAPEHDAVLDELVFDCTYRALREAGLRKQDVGLSVLASMDVYDGRSISSGLTTPSAGGYMSDAYRLEGDVGLAIVAAAQAIKAGDVDVAVAVGVHNPEVRAGEHAAFLEQISNLAFEPHFDRPVAITANVALAMDAVHAGASPEDMATIAAEEISRGAGGRHAVRRAAVSAEDVLASPPVAWPLHELMLPAASTGAAAVVLASPARARRARTARGQITGYGVATGDYTWSGAWLEESPASATRLAASDAYCAAGGDQPPAVAEVSAPTPALLEWMVGALGLSPKTTVINPSGGMRSNHPGLVNGALRLIEVVDWLDDHGPGRGVVHSLDTVTGPIAETATVLVVEAG